MPRLPRICGREARRAFERAGWTYTRTTGDHMILKMPGKRVLPLPDYYDVPTFIVRRLLRTAGMSVEEFLWFL